MLNTVLLELATAKFVVLYVYIASVLFIHFRSRVRLRFARQFLEHSGLMAPFNSLFYLFSAVPTTPIVGTSHFPELLPLRNGWKTIRDEAATLLDADEILPSHRHDDLVFMSFYKRGWKRFHLKWYGDFLPSARRLCPKTVELVTSIPNVRAAAFTVLPAGAELGKHRDPFAGSLRYHLGLITPNDDRCAIWVDGDKHTWHDGEDVVFDETMVHWARNDTSTTRVILFCDVTRPLHTSLVRGLNWLMMNTLGRATQSKNDEGESTGILNRVTAYIYRYKMFLRRVKSANRPLYHTAKYAFLLGLVYLILLRRFFDLP